MMDSQRIQRRVAKAGLAGLLLLGVAGGLALAPSATGTPPPSSPEPASIDPLAGFPGASALVPPEGEEHARPVLLYLCTPWSHDARFLARESLSDASLRELVREAFLWRYAEPAREPALARRFAGIALPALVVLDPAGGLVETISGYLPPAALREALRGAGARAEESGRQLAAARREAAAGEPGAPEQLASALLARRLDAQAISALRRVLTDDRREPFEQVATALDLARALLRQDRWLEAAPVLERARTLDADGDYRDELALTIAREGFRLGRASEALRLLDAPADPEAESTELALWRLLCRHRAGEPAAARRGLMRLWQRAGGSLRARIEAWLARLPAGDDAWRVLREGRELVSRLGCRECHRVEPEQEIDLHSSCADCHRYIRDSARDPERLRELHWRDPDWYRHVEMTTHYLEVPELTRAGAYLRPAWLKAFLRDPHDVRPFLEESMPRLPISEPQAELLVEYLQAIARPSAEARLPGSGSRVPSSEPAAVARGEALFLRQACNRCHVFGNRRFPASPAPGAVPAPQAPDLALTRERMEPTAAATWIRAPQTFRSAPTMPATPLNDDALDDLLAFLYHGERGAAAPAPAQDLAPRVTRRVRYEEVNEIFHTTCIHCHLEEAKGGIGSSGGGWGFAPRGLDLSSYTALMRGSLGEDGRRRSVVDASAGEPILLERLRRRVHENQRDFVAPHARRWDHAARPGATEAPRGMPLGLPALRPDEIALIEAWIAQGAPGPTSPYDR